MKGEKVRIKRTPIRAQREALCQVLPLTAREAKIQSLLGVGGGRKWPPRTLAEQRHL